MLLLDFKMQHEVAGTKNISPNLCKKKKISYNRDSLQESDSEGKNSKFIQDLQCAVFLQYQTQTGKVIFS